MYIQLSCCVVSRQGHRNRGRGTVAWAPNTVLCMVQCAPYNYNLCPIMIYVAIKILILVIVYSYTVILTSALSTSGLSISMYSVS